MTTLDTLLRAICLAPADALARLAFADLCEEQGDSVRAEFIRVQLREAELGTAALPSHNHRGGGCKTCRILRERSRLYERSARLFPDMVYPPLPNSVVCSRGDLADFRRGFLWITACDPIAFCDGLAETLFRWSPFEAVSLSGCRPWLNELAGEGEYVYHWCPVSRSRGTMFDDIEPQSGELPYALKDHIFEQAEQISVDWLASFRTEDAALIAISRAAVNFGRAKAGLPALYPAVKR